MMRARAIPSSPEIRKRSESTISGGAEVTRIRADVNALDQMTEKLTPISKERKSTCMASERQVRVGKRNG